MSLLFILAKDYSLLLKNYPEVIIVELLLLVIVVALFSWKYHSRKKKEKEYKKSNEWMYQLLSSMPEMAMIYDADLRLVDVVNPQEKIMLNIPLQERLNVSMRNLKEKDLKNKRTIELIADYVENTSITKKVNTFKFEVTRQGKVYYGAARTVPFLADKVICFAHDETEYVVAEKKSAELTSFFQSVVDNLPIGILVKDISNELRYVFFNNYLLDFFGNDNPFQIGQNDMDRWEPMTESFVKEDMMVANSGTPISFDRVFYDDETGQPIRWSITTKNKFIGPNGTPYLMASTIETTESKRKDFELIKTQRELTLVLEAGKVAAWVFDLKTRIFSALNGQTISQGGMSIDEFILLIHPEERLKFEQLIEKLASGELEKIKMIQRIMIEEKYEWYETFAIGMKSEKDGKIYQIIGTERNITEEINKQRSLEEAQSKLELSFTAAQIVPWEFDLKTKCFSSINPDAVESKKPTLSDYIEMLFPEDIRLFEEGMESILNGKKKIMTVQLRMTLPGVEQRWYELHATISERDENDNVYRVVGLRRDITALKMTDELIELREKAEQSNRLKSAFLANMSHEIRTPLNAIVGFSQLIMQTDEKEEMENYFNIIETNNDLLLQLISDILDLSKIEAGEMDFFYSEFELSTIMQNLEQIYAAKVKQNVQLKLDLPERLCKIFSERNRLTQVISNFLSNACKFTIEGVITMGYSYTDNGLRFFVRDTGKGIEPENIHNVFSRFSKFDTFVQGTGLGLSISEFIIKHLDGEIGVNSELGKGSEFWFTIPCEPIIL